MRHCRILWLAGFVILAAVSGLVLFIWRLNAMSDRPRMIIEEEVGNGITYAVGLEGTDPETWELVTSVTYDYDSLAGIQAYVAFNQAALAQLERSDLQTLQVEVVFNHPLSQADLERFVAETGLKVEQYSLRAVQSDGQRVTIYGGPPDDVNLVSDEQLAQVLQDIKDRADGHLQGWISVEGQLPTANAQQVSVHPDVFLLDVVETVISQSLTPENLSKTGMSKEIQQLYLTGKVRPAFSRPPLFWSLENLDLVKDGSQ